MALLCFGLNHKTTPVEIREKVAVAEHAIPETTRSVMSLPGIEECLIVSTCNRMELYAHTSAENATELKQRLESWLLERADLPEAQHANLRTYAWDDVDAVQHLFEVVSGMDSMVLGETEIFGQVKKSYQMAYECQATGPVLNRLFQQSFRVGKHVRTHSRIQNGATSVGGVAVELAEKIFGELNHCTVMILGAGETSRLTAKALVSRGAKSLIVSNRSYDRAVELANEMEGEAIHFDAWADRLSMVDIVIASTAAPHAVVHAEVVAQSMRKRQGRPLFFIDIAVPRDVEPAVNEIDGAYLYDIDALQAIAQQSRRDREAQILECRRMIEAQRAKLGYGTAPASVVISQPSSDPDWHPTI
jgi:glutamyl-tRNA reductase